MIDQIKVHKKAYEEWEEKGNDEGGFITYFWQYGIYIYVVPVELIYRKITTDTLWYIKREEAHKSIYSEIHYKKDQHTECLQAGIVKAFEIREGQINE